MNEGMLDLVKAAPDLLKLVYKDLAQPGVQQVGKAIGTLLEYGNSFLLPLKLKSEKSKATFEYNMQKYRKQLEGVQNERICKVLPEIGVPILDKLTYVSAEGISDLFINLLSKASTQDTVDSAHPSFVHIINSISSDEARILELLQNKLEIPFISGIEQEPRKNGVNIDFRYLTGIEKKLELDFPNNLRFYLENLTALGILVLREGIAFGGARGRRIGEEISKLVRHTYKSQIDQARKKSRSAYEVQEGFFEVTNFGRKFIETCTTKLKEEA